MKFGLSITNVLELICQLPTWLVEYLDRNVAARGTAESTCHVVAMGQEVWSQSRNKAQSRVQRDDHHHLPGFSASVPSHGPEWIRYIPRFYHPSTSETQFSTHNNPVSLAETYWQIHVRRWNDQSSERWSDFLSRGQQQKRSLVCFLPFQGYFL